MANHDTVCVRPTQHVVAQLDLVVQFLDRWLAGLLIGSGKFWRLAKLVGVDFEVLAQSFNELRHCGVRHDHTSGDLRRLTKVLNKVEDEFIAACHHDHAGAEDAAANSLGNAGTNVLRPLGWTLASITSVTSVFLRWVVLSHFVSTDEMPPDVFVIQPCITDFNTKRNNGALSELRLLSLQYGLRMICKSVWLVTNSFNTHGSKLMALFRKQPKKSETESKEAEQELAQSKKPTLKVPPEDKAPDPPVPAKPTQRVAAATTPPTQVGGQQRTVKLDDTKASVAYANFCRVSGTPEELIIDFGMNDDSTGVAGNTIEINQKVVINFFTAKRLQQAINVAVQRHEGVFGNLETDVAKRFTPEAIQQIQQAQQLAQQAANQPS